MPSPQTGPKPGSKLRNPLILLVGTASVSSAAVLIVLSGVDPAAIAVWRLGAAALIFAPFAFGSLRRELGSLSGRERAWLVLGGVAFGLHFVLFNTGFRTTSYESTVILLAAQPLFAAVLGRFFLGEKVTPSMVLSTAVGGAGLAILVWRDYRFDPAHLPGDAIVLACCVLLTIAYVFSRGLRTKLGVPVFVSSFYMIGAATSAVYMAISGQRLLHSEAGPPGFIAIGLLILIPTLLGHTVYSFGLKYISAFTINLVVLAEPLVAIAMKYVLRSSFEVFRDSELGLYHAVGGAVLAAGIVIGLAGSSESKQP